MVAGFEQLKQQPVVPDLVEDFEYVQEDGSCGLLFVEVLPHLLHQAEKLMARGVMSPESELLVRNKIQFILEFTTQYHQFSDLPHCR